MFAGHLGFTAIGTGEITLNNYTVASSNSSPDPAKSIYKLASSGYAQESINDGAFTNIEQVCTGDVSDYEVRVGLFTGDTPFGPVGTWENLSTEPFWRLTASSEGTLTTDLYMEIRDVATETSQATAVITLEATQA